MTRRLLAIAAGLWVCAPWAVANAADAAPTPCRIAAVKQALLCGQVQRPLDPQQPGSPTIAVHYAVLPATARHKRDDPVFFLAGGPGQSAIALAGSVLPLFQRLSNRRDIVFIDQRGTGRSAPLECEPDDALPLADRLDTARSVARLQACRQRLQDLPWGRLDAYTTPLAMTDADAVRAVLGAARVNLVGGSYGTRAALEYLRQFPLRVRRIVLDGVAPPDMALPASLGVDAQAALAALFADCRRDPACAERHPQLAEQWQALRARMPVTTRVPDPADGRPTDVRVGLDTLAAAVRGPLYAPALAAALPFAIDEAASGRYMPLLGLANSLGGGSRATRIAEGQHFSVICSEDYPRLPPQRGPNDPMAAAYARPYELLCRDWPRRPMPADFYRIAPSPVPVLAFSGTLDPVTPPRHGERVVRALGPKARHIVVPRAGHGVLAIGCARELLERFIDSDDEAQALAVDASCLMTLPRPPAFEPPRPGAAVPGSAR